MVNFGPLVLYVFHYFRLIAEKQSTSTSFAFLAKSRLALPYTSKQLTIPLTNLRLLFVKRVYK